MDHGKHQQRNKFISLSVSNRESLKLGEKSCQMMALSLYGP